MGDEFKKNINWNNILENEVGKNGIWLQKIRKNQNENIDDKKQQILPRERRITFITKAQKKSKNEVFLLWYTR